MKGGIIALLKAQARELRSLRKGLDKHRAEVRALMETAKAPTVRDGAVKRRVAAQLMGVGESKLDALVRHGKVATAEDVRLIPMSEIRRYTAPKPKRQRKPAVGHRARMKHIDGQSDAALDELRQRLREKGRAAT